MLSCSVDISLYIRSKQIKDKGRCGNTFILSGMEEYLSTTALVRLKSVGILERCARVDTLIVWRGGGIFYRKTNINRCINTFCVGLKIYLPEHYI